MSLPLNQVIVGDSAVVMAEWPENSVDCIVTDPPYGISFMGKSWDKALPPRAVFAEMFRVLKPGALAFVMSSPRQDVLWRMLALLEGVGFQLRQSAMFWVYRTGFPKALDVSKGIDKKRHDKIRPVCRWLRTKIDDSDLTIQNIADHFGFHTRMIYHWAANDSDSQPALPTWKQWSELKTLLKFGDEMDDTVFALNKRKGVFGDAFYQREITGQHESKDAGGFGDYRLKGINQDITEPHSDLAKKWEGWKSQTGLKPAVEMVLMVNKPRSESTIVDNVLRWGTGAINVDACRIPFQNEEDINEVKAKANLKQSNPSSVYKSNVGVDRYLLPFVNQKGRFPANLIISDGALDTGETTKSRAGIRRNKNTDSILKKGFEGTPKDVYSPIDDEGSPFRHFDLDAWAVHRGFLDVAKPSRAERDFGLWGFNEESTSLKYAVKEGRGRLTERPNTKHRNTHATVKPVKLMAYLIELGCPKDGVVVDPFLGSGTTCIAAKKLRRKWIGIELDPEYAKIAEARINIRGPMDKFLTSKEPES